MKIRHKSRLTLHERGERDLDNRNKRKKFLLAVLRRTGDQAKRWGLWVAFILEIVAILVGVTIEGPSWTSLGKTALIGIIPIAFLSVGTLVWNTVSEPYRSIVARLDALENHTASEDHDERSRFQGIYREIDECRRGIDTIRSDPHCTGQELNVWAAYAELEAVLGSMGVSFPVFSAPTDDAPPDPQWNANHLRSMFLRKLAILARLGDLESARSYLESDEWKTTCAEYAYGPPIKGG